MQCLRLAKSIRFISTKPKLLTVESHFGDLLKRIAGEQKFVNYDLKIDPVSTGGANYTSKLYRVRLSEQDRVLHLFAKVAAIGEKMRSQAPRIYETENFAYTKLAKIYEELQEEHQVPDEYRLFFTKFYGSHTKEYEETLVLEDLMMAGYESYDRFKAITWPYSKRAVEELAKMHALSFSYAKCRPDDFKQVVGKLKFEYKLDQNDMKIYYTRIINRAVEAVQEKHKTLVADYFKDFDQEDFKALYKTSRGIVIGHSDFRPNNLMIRCQRVSFKT
ncbi:unnamed protein product [Chrysodeixis includens]|uniref:CHK kinase-like domain-containing protein n=1 Tax=Chrysodeixis includens TaxID=689277 RepID=A0A9N8L5S0_CHRIL|nr:unnamed protein product [Chrysodeixis includens]